MLIRKIPISFNEKESEIVQKIIDLMGIGGVYGDFTKAIKFSIVLALSTIQNPGKVYSGLNADEMAIFFKTIAKAELRSRLIEKAQDLEKEAQKV